MFGLRTAARVLIVASVLLYSSETDGQPQPSLVKAPTSTPPPVSTGVHIDEQQVQAAQMFDQEGLFTLSRLNYESRDETKAERCKLFEETLRSIYRQTRPELAGARTPAVYQAAIKGLEGRNPPALVALKECEEREQSPSLISKGNQQQQQRKHVHSPELRQTLEQLIGHRASDHQLLKQLESDLAREKSRGEEREREMDEFRAGFTKVASEKALSKLEFEFEECKQDISRLMQDQINFVDKCSIRATCQAERRKHLALIHKRAEEFKIVMRGQLDKAMNKIDILKAKRAQDDQQYARVKEGFSKLESDFEKFKQGLDKTFLDFNRFSSRGSAEFTNARLEEFHGELKRQLGTALDYIFAENTIKAQESQQGELETRQIQPEPEPKKLDIHSKLDQLKKAQEQSMKQHVGNNELLEEMKSDLARDANEQLVRALNNIDSLGADQMQHSQQYEPVKDSLRGLQSKFEQSKQDLADKLQHMGAMYTHKEAMSIMKQFDDIIAALNEIVGAALSYTIARESKQVQ